MVKYRKMKKLFVISAFKIFIVFIIFITQLYFYINHLNRKMLSNVSDHFSSINLGSFSTSGSLMINSLAKAAVEISTKTLPSESMKRSCSLQKLISKIKLKKRLRYLKIRSSLYQFYNM